MPAPKKENEKDPSAALGMTIRRGLSRIPFIPRREPTSAPSGHLLPEEGGSVKSKSRISASPFYGTEGVCRLPPIVISSECEKSFSFAVKNRGEERDHGKHRTPCSAGCRYVKGLSRIPFHPAAGANLRPFGAPPSGGRRECAAFLALSPHLNTRTGWRPVRAVFLESSEWSSHKTIGL